MLLHDNNILSTFAKASRLDLLFTVFNRTTLHLSGNVEAEIQRGVELGYSFLQPVLDLINNPQGDVNLEVLHAGPQEQALYDHIPFYPLNDQRESKGEMDTVALAWTTGATIVCNERKVYNFCRTNTYRTIQCVRLEDILRELWTSGQMNRREVLALINLIERVDRVQVLRSEVF